MKKTTHLMVLPLFALMLAGCSAQSENVGDAADPSDLNNAQATAAEYVSRYYDGTYGTPPTDPSPIVPGKDLWVIDCTSNSTSCSEPNDSVVAVANEVGWTTHRVDGKRSPDTQSQLIRQAIAANADGIVTTAIDCANIKQPLAEAAAAGIPVYGNFSLECDEQGSGEALYAALGTTQGQSRLGAAQREQGELQAAWVADKLGSAGGKVILTKIDAPQVAAEIYTGAANGLRKYCPQCEVVEMGVQTTEFGTKLQSKAQTTLSQNPDAKAIIALFDSVVEQGVGPALQAAGRTDVLLTGSQATPNAVKLITDSSIDFMTVAESAQLQGYEAVDALNLLFQSKEPSKSINGWQLIDKEHNIPKNGDKYSAPIDFRSAYLSRWGLS